MESCPGTSAESGLIGSAQEPNRRLLSASDEAQDREVSGQSFYENGRLLDAHELFVHFSILEDDERGY